MAQLLQDHVVIVTGSGRGIGAATAKLFAEHGARVVVSDLDAEPAEETAQAIADGGGEAITVIGDVTDPQFPARLMETTVDAFGKLNVLVNNAGFTWDGVIHKMSDEQWQAMLDVHATASFRMIRATVPYMRDVAKQELAENDATSENRCIINVSSTSGLHGNAGQANYSTAKMGLVGLTKAVAKEWGRFNVRCNAVAFGYVDTRLTQAKEEGTTIEYEGEEIALGIPENLRQMTKMVIPLGRAGTPEEAAGGVLLMASPLAAYITGHVLEVTGGYGI